MPEADRAGNWKLTIPSNLSGLKRGLDELGNWLSDHSVGQGTTDKAHLVFEEIINNISRYGFDDRDEHAIEVTGRMNQKEVTLIFEDSGRPFDPRTQPAPKLAASLEEATIGGRGIMLVRASASRLDYERTPSGRNRLTVTLAR